MKFWGLIFTSLKRKELLDPCWFCCIDYTISLLRAAFTFMEGHETAPNLHKCGCLSNHVTPLVEVMNFYCVGKVCWGITHSMRKDASDTCWRVEASRLVTVEASLSVNPYYGLAQSACAELCPFVTTVSAEAFIPGWEWQRLYQVAAASMGGEGTPGRERVNPTVPGSD